MPGGSCYTCIKYLMFAFNFLFWLLGCAILGVGIWILVDENFDKYVDGADEFKMLHTGAYILIAVGVIIMVIGFLGCCGAIKESQCMLGLFFAFLFLIFAILLGAGIWAIVAKDSMQEMVNSVLLRESKRCCDLGDDGRTRARNFMDLVQRKFECCGATGIIDYGISTAGCLTEKYVPCDGVHTTTGCTQKLFDFFANSLLIIAGVAIGIAVILILGMIFSMVLCCAIRDTTA